MSVFRLLNTLFTTSSNGRIVYTGLRDANPTTIVVNPRGISPTSLLVSSIARQRIDPSQLWWDNLSLDGACVGASRFIMTVTCRVRLPRSKISFGQCESVASAGIQNVMGKADRAPPSTGWGPVKKMHQTDASLASAKQDRRKPYSFKPGI